MGTTGKNRGKKKGEVLCHRKRNYTVKRGLFIRVSKRFEKGLKEIYENRRRKGGREYFPKM